MGFKFDQSIQFVNFLWQLTITFNTFGTTIEIVILLIAFPFHSRSSFGEFRDESRQYPFDYNVTPVDNFGNTLLLFSQD